MSNRVDPGLANGTRELRPIAEILVVEHSMIDPSVEQLVLVSKLAQFMYDAGFRGRSDQPAHRSYGYRLVEQGLEVLTYCGQMYTSKEAIIRFLQGREAEKRRNSKFLSRAESSMPWLPTNG